METEIYCNKCNSTNIEIYWTNKPEPERISMDEYCEKEGSDSPQFTISNLVLRYRTEKYKAMCLNCLYTVCWKKQVTC